jgi:hypothetical protein
MSRQNLDKKKDHFFQLLKNPTFKRIVRYVQLPIFFLAFCFIALKSFPLFESALHSLTSTISIQDPGYECSFVNLEHPEAIAQIKQEIAQHTHSFSLLNGTEKLSKKLLNKVAQIGSITCSLDRHRKLHFVITGKGQDTLLAKNETMQSIPGSMPMQVPQHHTTLMRNNTKTHRELLSIFDEMDTLLRSTSTIHSAPHNLPLKHHYLDALAPFFQTPSTSFLQPFHSEQRAALISCQREHV